MLNYSTYCQVCGFESPDNARFCRQCGASLLSEGDQAEPPTRNYGRAGQPAVGTASSPLPPSIGDAVAGDTFRYQNPMQPAPPPYVPPGRFTPAPNTKSLKSKRRLLKWGGMLLALFISGGIGAAINEEANSGRYQLSPEDRSRLERIRSEDRLKNTLTGSIIEYNDREREQLERRMEEIYRAKEEAERAAERGDLRPTGEKPLDLSEFEYQGATTGQYSRIPGRELLTQRTKDDFETIVAFYQQKFGKPFIQLVERNQKQALFQTSGTPSITVMIRESNERGRQPEIIILRSPFRFPVEPVEAAAPKAPNAEESAKPAADQKPAPETKSRTTVN